MDKYCVGLRAMTHSKVLKANLISLEQAVGAVLNDDSALHEARLLQNASLLQQNLR